MKLVFSESPKTGLLAARPNYSNHYVPTEYQNHALICTSNTLTGDSLLVPVHALGNTYEGKYEFGPMVQKEMSFVVVFLSIFISYRHFVHLRGTILAIGV